jgi:hypothetical protein
MPGETNRLLRSSALYRPLTATAAVMAYAWLVMGHFSTGFTLQDGPNALGLSFGYGLDEVQQFFAARTKEQLLCYRHFIAIWDSLFTVIYSMMHAAWIAFFFPARRLLLFLPLLHMLLDWIENLCEGFMVDAWLQTRTISENLVCASSWITRCKWTASLLIYATLAAGLWVMVVHSVRRQKTNSLKTPDG